MNEWRLSVLILVYLTATAVLNAQDNDQSRRDIREFLLVDLNALHQPLGPTRTFKNQGIFGGQFEAIGSPTVVQVIKGRRALTMDGHATLVSTFDAGVKITGRSDFTVAVWVYNPQVSVEECLVSWSKRDGDTGTGAQLNYGTNEFYGAVNHWWNQEMKFEKDLSWWSHMGFNGGVLSAGQWHHMVVTYDGADEVLYLDGVLNNSVKANLNISSNAKICIGSTSQRHFFSGSLAGIEIYDVALSQTEISYLYQTGDMSTPILQWWQSVERNSPSVTDRDRSVRYFESRLSAYGEMFRKSSHLRLDHDPLYGELWYRLARAKEHALFEKSHVAEAYKRAMLSPHGDWAVAKLDALLPREDFSHCIDEIYREVDLRRLTSILVSMVRNEASWPALEILLNSIAKRGTRAKGMVSSVHDATRGQERAIFMDACRKTSTLDALVLRIDLRAIQALADQDNIKGAVEEVRRVLPAYSSQRAKVTLEFRLAELLLMSGNPREAIALLSTFQERRRYTDRSIAAEALCVKGQCHMELGEPDRAVDCYFGVVSEYPEAKKASSSAFLIGYVNMLQGRLAAANDAFGYVVRRYPEADVSKSALKYMERIEVFLGK